MATKTIAFKGKDYTLNTGGDMTPEGQEQGLTAEMVGFEEDFTAATEARDLAATNSLDPEVPNTGGGVYIAVNTTPDGKAQLIWKYISGGNPDTTIWFPS